MKLDKYQLAWAAGFFDGEGNTIAATRSVQMRVSQVDVRSLVRFHFAVGALGNIVGPYNNRTYQTKSGLRDGAPYYVWIASNFEHVQAVLAMLWRFLSAPKREQAVSEIRKWREDRVARALAANAACLVRLAQSEEQLAAKLARSQELYDSGMTKFQITYEVGISGSYLRSLTRKVG